MKVRRVAKNAVVKRDEADVNKVIEACLRWELSVELEGGARELMAGEVARWQGYARVALYHFNRSFKEGGRLAEESAFRSALASFQLGLKTDLGGLISEISHGRVKTGRVSLLEDWAAVRHAREVTSASLARKVVRPVIRRWKGVRWGAREGQELSVLSAMVLAEAYLVLGEMNRARGALEKGLKAAQERGWITYAAWLNALLAETLELQGQVDLAFERLQEALELFRRMSSPWGIFQAQSRIGDLLRIERTGDALKPYEDALQAAEEAGDRKGIVRMLCSIAGLHIEEGAYARAKRMIKRARGYAKGIHDVQAHLAVEVAYLRWLIAKGRLARAAEQLAEIASNYPVRDLPESYRELREIALAVPYFRTHPLTSQMFEDAPVCEVAGHVFDVIVAEAKRNYPNEFGAILHGFPRITEIEFTPDTGRSHGMVIFNLYNRFSGRYVTGDGVVHSHPSGVARPSRADRMIFSKFPGYNLIIGYPFTVENLHAYDRAGNRVRVRINRRKDT